MLLVGGTTGLVGRALREEFGDAWTIRSVHRHASPAESAPNVEPVPADAASPVDWAPLLQDVDLVVNVAWYRAGSDRKFAPLAGGLQRLIRAAEAAHVPRFVHLSVPPATEGIEHSLPYMVRKREVDATLAASALSYAIVRPTMLFGPNDKLLTVMLRTMARWHTFPMFGDGAYHVSPIAVADLARIVRKEAGRSASTTVLAGGPRRWAYRELTDRLYRGLRLPPRYFRLSARGGERLARVLESFGSSLLYAYEVEWLVSDLLGLPPYDGLDRPLTPLEPFLDSEAARLRRVPAQG